MKRPTDEREVFLAEYLQELRENNAAVFVGAGLSRGAGYVDWVGLLSPIAAGLGLDARRETDLVGVAQFHLKHPFSSNRQRIA